MISLIVPAHNEQASLARTLEAIHESARLVGGPYEIIVVDDASTDATAEIARQNNARVVKVNHRQIAATRNSGARAALGERLFFVDADTTINSRALAAALRAMDKGAVGGGGPVRFDADTPLYGKLLALLSPLVAKLSGFTGGAFMFCTREAFLATGGFNESLYWSEEGAFALALKQQGRFFVLWEGVLTSGRRLRRTSPLMLLVGGARLIFSPRKMFTRRSSVEKIWYDSNRAGDDVTPISLAARVSNGIALLAFIVLLTAPLWSFVPWALTPLSSPLGKIRFAIATFACHAGLISWPIAMILLVQLTRQRPGKEWAKLAALAAFCLLLGWDSTRGTARIWAWCLHWLTLFHNG